MHTPDGFLTGWICVAMLIVSLVAVLYSFYKIKDKVTKNKIYMMSGVASAIFGLQMLNFPIASGTSGHLIGGALAAILLGRHAAVIIMTAVVGIQALVYGDGGVLALGANIFAMGVVSSYVADYSMKYIDVGQKHFNMFVASTLSVVTASLSIALMLWVSGITFLEVVPAMLFSHLFIGMGEAMITIFVVGYVVAVVSKEWESRSHMYFAKQGMIALLLTVVMVSFALPFASGNPDGLEKVAINLGFFENAVELYSFSLMPDYTAFGSEAYAAVLFSGIVGMGIVFGMVAVTMNGIKQFS